MGDEGARYQYIKTIITCRFWCTYITLEQSPTLHRRASDIVKLNVIAPKLDVCRNTYLLPRDMFHCNQSMRLDNLVEYLWRIFRREFVTGLFLLRLTNEFVSFFKTELIPMLGPVNIANFKRNQEYLSVAMWTTNMCFDCWMTYRFILNNNNAIIKLEHRQFDYNSSFFSTGS